MLLRIIHRERDFPRQTAGSDVIEGEKKYGTRGGNCSIKARRQNQNEWREPDQVLGANAGRENKEDQPRVSERFDKCAATGVATLPCDPERGRNHEQLENQHNNVLRRLEIKERQPTKIREAGCTEQISDSPNSPVASVSEHVLGE